MPTSLASLVTQFAGDFSLAAQTHIDALMYSRAGARYIKDSRSSRI